MYYQASSNEMVVILFICYASLKWGISQHENSYLYFSIRHIHQNVHILASLSLPQKCTQRPAPHPNNPTSLKSMKWASRLFG